MEPGRGRRKRRRGDERGAAAGTSGGEGVRRRQRGASGFKMAIPPIQILVPEIPAACLPATPPASRALRPGRNLDPGSGSLHCQTASSCRSLESECGCCNGAPPFSSAALLPRLLNQGGSPAVGCEREPSQGLDDSLFGVGEGTRGGWGWGCSHTQLLSHSNEPRPLVPRGPSSTSPQLAPRGSSGSRSHLRRHRRRQAIPGRRGPRRYISRIPSAPKYTLPPPAPPSLSLVPFSCPSPPLVDIGFLSSPLPPPSPWSPRPVPIAMLLPILLARLLDAAADADAEVDAFSEISPWASRARRGAAAVNGATAVVGLPVPLITISPQIHRHFVPAP